MLFALNMECSGFDALQLLTNKGLMEQLSNIKGQRGKE